MKALIIASFILLYFVIHTDGIRGGGQLLSRYGYGRRRNRVYGMVKKHGRASRGGGQIIGRGHGDYYTDEGSYSNTRSSRGGGQHYRGGKRYNHRYAGSNEKSVRSSRGGGQIRKVYNPYFESISYSADY